ncbi:hypothetical protein ACVBEH_21845 [Roseateles sp. GG27B]
MISITPPSKPSKQPLAHPGRQRKLHVGHFAFMRSVVQGLDPRDSWTRYLQLEGEATDQRVVRATIAWIRDEFAAAAKRLARPGTARLVRMDVSQLAGPAHALPSLEAFAQERGLEDFGQAEQVAAYEEAYGPATQRSRYRARLITRRSTHCAGSKAWSPKRRRRATRWPGHRGRRPGRPISSRWPSWWNASTNGGRW